VKLFGVSFTAPRILVVISGIWCAALIIRKDAFLKVGGHRPVFVRAEDYDLWLRIAQHFQIANLDRVVLKYRIHPDQISMRKRREQTLCILAAQVAASSRRNGIPDPLNAIEEITPTVMAGLGVTEATQQRAIALDCYRWIRNMCMAAEYSFALEAAVELLQSDLK
jgi:hypothetical protein